MILARRCVALITGTAVVLGLAACSAHEEGSGLTINEAKRQVQEMENRIASLVPEEYVQSQHHTAARSLASCGNDLYRWWGHTKLALTAEPDFERILRSILAGVKQDPDYDVRMGKRIDGEPRADIWGPLGAFYIADPSVDQSQYEIESSSPCFKLPDGMSPWDKY